MSLNRDCTECTNRGTIGLILHLTKQSSLSFLHYSSSFERKKSNLGLLWSRMLKKSMIVVTLCWWKTRVELKTWRYFCTYSETGVRISPSSQSNKKRKEKGLNGQLPKARRSCRFRHIALSKKVCILQKRSCRGLYNLLYIGKLSFCNFKGKNVQKLGKPWGWYLIIIELTPWRGQLQKHKLCVSESITVS